MGACAGTRKKMIQTAPTSAVPSEGLDTEPSLKYSQSQGKESGVLKQSPSKPRLSTKRRDLTISSFLVPGAVVTNRPKGKEDYERLVAALAGHQVLSELTEDAIDVVIDRMKHFYLSAGTTICHQGDVATHFFVVASGCVEMRQDGEMIENLGPGDSFGELALLYMTKRQATAVAVEDTGLWGVDRGKFREAVESVNIRIYHESQTFLNTVPIFNVLSKAQKEALLSALVLQKFKPATDIVKEGEAGDAFFIIKEGIVACTVKGKEQRRLGKGEFFGEQALLYHTERTATITAVDTVKAYTTSGYHLTQILGRSLQQLIYRNTLRISFDRSPYFSKLSHDQKEDLLDKFKIDSHSANTIVIDPAKGGRGLWVVLKGSLRGEGGDMIEALHTVGDQEAFEGLETSLKASYMAESPCDVAYISLDTLEAVLGGRVTTIFNANEAMAILKKIGLFAGFAKARLTQMVAALRIVNYDVNSMIVEQSETVSRLIMVKSGAVRVVVDGNTAESMGNRSYFCEKSIISPEISQYSLISLEKVVCFELQKEDFWRIADERTRESIASRIKITYTDVQITDLRPVKLLRKTEFGFTALTVDPKTRTVYALKTIYRKRLSAFSLNSILKQEIEILKKINHCLMVKLVKIEKDETRLFLLLEYVPGHPLHSIIRSIGQAKDHEIRFYAASLILMLEHLHEKAIVYRDLKPDQIIVDTQVTLISRDIHD